MVAAWRSCVEASTYDADGGFPVGDLPLPYTDGEGAPDEPTFVDIDDGARVRFGPESVGKLLAACERWVEVGAPAPADELVMQLLLDAAAAKSGGDALPLPPLLSGTAVTAIAIPVGGMWSSEEPVLLAEHCVVGHLGRSLEVAATGLTVNGLPVPNRVALGSSFWWTEDWLAAESDGEDAESLENRLLADAGWLPLVVVLATQTIGSAAALETLSKVRALCAAAWLLDGGTDQAMPWVLGLDGPRDAYAGSDTFRLEGAVTDSRNGVGSRTRSIDIRFADAPVSFAKVIRDHRDAIQSLVGFLADPAAVEVLELIYLAGRPAFELRFARLASELAVRVTWPTELSLLPERIAHLD